MIGEIIIKYYNLVLNIKIKLNLTKTMQYVFLIFKYLTTHKTYSKPCLNIKRKKYMF